MTMEEVREILPSISYACLCHKYGKLEKFIEAGNDAPTNDYFDCFYSALWIAGDKVSSHYNEDWCVASYYFSYQAMMDYYRLCRVYGKRRRIRLKENPFMKKAETFVNRMMDLGYGYYAFRLQTKVNHRWASGVVIYIDENGFNAEFEMVEAMFAIGDWYARAELYLWSVLDREGAFQSPALPAHESEEERNEQ